MYFPVPPTDPRLAEIERLRKAAKQESVPYFIVEIDNTAGSAELDFAGVDVWDKTGGEVYESSTVDSSIAYYLAHRDGPTRPGNQGGELTGLARRYRESYMIVPGEKKRTLIFDGWKAGAGVPYRVVVGTGPDFMTSARATKVAGAKGP